MNELNGIKEQGYKEKLNYSEEKYVKESKIINSNNITSEISTRDDHDKKKINEYTNKKNISKNKNHNYSDKSDKYEKLKKSIYMERSRDYENNREKKKRSDHNNIYISKHTKHYPKNYNNFSYKK